MNLTPQSPFSSKASQLLSWGHWFTFANIGLVLLISSSYLFADKTPASLLGGFYMLITWLSHTSFITFCAFVLTIFPLSLVFPYPRHIRGMAALIATCGVSILSLDAFVYFQLGYHLNLQSGPEIVSLLWNKFSDSPFITSVLAIGFVLLVLIFELLAGNRAWRHLAELKQYRFPKYATVALVGCFATSHSIHIWADANAYFDITKQDNVLPLSYPTTAKTLLARHDLLDIKRYEKAHDISLTQIKNPFSVIEPIPICKAPTNKPVTIAVFKQPDKLAEFVTRQQLVPIKQLLQPTNHEDALFNLIYGLPAFYKPAMSQQPPPPWSASEPLLSVTGFESFNDILNPESPIKIISASALETQNNIQGTIIAFSLAPVSTDVIHNSVLYSNDFTISQQLFFKQLQDITYTLVASHLNCSELASHTMLGRDLQHSASVEGVNYTQGVLVAFKKDRITLVSQDGSYKNLSGTEGFDIDQKLDIPFLINSIKILKKFSLKKSEP
ncbi:hypothetical protein PSECIP111951_01186 [Pseudoalteromonas holothuriae]|uniref:Inner membrane protein YejM N-terminal domain-containing protein n=1 Tax=Pseudoalteromonas holothuriae TaxID=2963714 RepID=A0A9W4VQQ0_9GAMM|nr:MULTISPECIES: DUF3413 domain-containing protein [unclassified Pseudoalteromonas]CAH9055169.1 hypothetical protein PSECIP111951_01186 [Pseudoalteromonas sp. CIP111951]CAH9057869.1 hypothetical protein PSECIP111854_02084 [Pseudoalteromonas sp. CIP111854]